MKLITLALLFTATCSAQIDTPAETPPPSCPPPFAPSKPQKPAEWSVAGKWTVTHPDWKGLLHIKPDGTFERPHGDGGKWILTADDGRLLLVLRWESWGTESALMATPDHFRGHVSRGAFELRRVPSPAPDPAIPRTEADLKKLLSDSSWRMPDGKEFVLHADGTTGASWHGRRGSWRVTGNNSIDLSIAWKATKPHIWTVDGDGKVLRHAGRDAEYAERIEQ